MKNITILLMCSLMYRAWTVETTWNGAGGDNLWMTAGNWESGVVPGVNDIVRFVAGGSPQSPVLLSDAVVTNGLFSSAYKPETRYMQQFPTLCCVPPILPGATRFVI